MANNVVHTGVPGYDEDTVTNDPFAAAPTNTPVGYDEAAFAPESPQDAADTAAARAQASKASQLTEGELPRTGPAVDIDQTAFDASNRIVFAPNGDPISGDAAARISGKIGTEVTQSTVTNQTGSPNVLNSHFAVMAAAGMGEAKGEDANTQVTKNGHVFQLNDTPGSESITLAHSNGKASINMGTDGSITFKAGENEIILSSEGIRIKGGNIIVETQGNASINTSGTFGVSSKSFNVTSESLSEKISGSRNSTVSGNIGVTAKGSMSTTVAGTKTDLTLGTSNQYVKGSAQFASTGPMMIAANGVMSVSAGQYNMSASNGNIIADNLTVTGNTGVMGSEGIKFYGQGATFEEGVTAPTFHGELDGRAQEANYSEWAEKAGAIASRPPGLTIDPNEPTPTIPNEGGGDYKPQQYISEILNNSNRGIQEVRIDPDDEIAKSIDRSEYNNGLSGDDITLANVRNLRRDEATVQDQDLVTKKVGDGTLSPKSVRPTPSGGVKRVGSRNPTYYAPGASPTGPAVTAPARSKFRKFLPPARYHITENTQITGDTELWPGVKLSTFFTDSEDPIPGASRNGDQKQPGIHTPDPQAVGPQ